MQTQWSRLKTLFKVGTTNKKMHRVLEFQQKALLKPFIKRNTELVKEAEKEGNEVKKQNAKLRSNVIFGKSKKKNHRTRLI